MPRLAEHLRRRRWLIAAAVVAALAWCSGFAYFSCAIPRVRCTLSSGTLLMSFATRGNPFQPHLGIGEFHTLPNWTFERGWWQSGGCTTDSLHIAMPLWIPFVSTCLMASFAPLIPVRIATPSRLMVGKVSTQPTSPGCASPM